MRYVYWKFKGSYCCCILKLIFLQEGSDENVLRHELGHYKQWLKYGPIKYFFKVWIRSIWAFWFRRNLSYEEYHNLPWEKEADILGGVK